MALSNTATPRYYGEFRKKVWAGEIPVNKEIEMEMNRIDDLIADPRYYYDDGAIEGFILFCEKELTLTDGSDVHLLDSFKLWAEQLLAWFYYTDRSVYEPYADRKGGHYVRKKVLKRLTVKQYLIVARGAAKSMYASFLHAYFLTIDGSTTHQIAVAPTMKQSEEVLSPLKTAISRAKGPLFAFMTEGSLQNTTGSRAQRQKLASTKRGIENFLTNSICEIRPMAVDKLQGLRPSLSTVDEWLSGDVREDVIGAIEQGAAKGDIDYTIIAISSEGVVRNGVGDTMKIELQKILKGEFYSPQTSIWHYKLDSIEEVNQPEMWVKAQPNLGITVSYETYENDKARAEAAPSTRNDILAKRFGIPTEGLTYFFTYEEIQPVRQKLDFYRMPCAMGADLSQGDDFTAFTFLFPLSDGRFGIKTRSYITELTLMRLHLAMRNKYEEFIQEGTLMVMDGAILDMDEIFNDLDNHIIEQEYDVRTFGYDPWGATKFVKRWEDENGSGPTEKVIQGARTESVPLGELKRLASEGMLLFDEQLMTFAMGNSIVLEDTNGNRKLYKKRREDKIDNVAAMMDAFVAYKLHTDYFE